MSKFDWDSFDPDEYEEISFGPLPPGDYEAIISDIEQKATRAGTGMYLSIRFDVIAGPHAKRSVWTNINVENPNPQAESIGRTQLASLARATGIAKPRSADAFEGATLIIVVDHEDYQGKTKNRVKRFKERTGASSSPKAWNWDGDDSPF